MSNIFEEKGISIDNRTVFWYEGDRYVVLNCECPKPDCTNAVVARFPDDNSIDSMKVQYALENNQQPLLFKQRHPYLVDEDLTYHLLAKKSGKSIDQIKIGELIERQKNLAITAAKNLIGTLPHIFGIYLLSVKSAVEKGLYDKEEMKQIVERLAELSARFDVLLTQFANDEEYTVDHAPGVLGLAIDPNSDIREQIVAHLREAGHDLPDEMIDEMAETIRNQIKISRASHNKPDDILH